VQLLHKPSGLVVKCQATRSRTQNRKTARKLLGERLEELALGPGARTAVRAREKSRKKASADKKARRKYRALEEEKERKKGGVKAILQGEGEVVEEEALDEEAVEEAEEHEEQNEKVDAADVAAVVGGNRARQARGEDDDGRKTQKSGRRPAR